jgi:endonuclease YncB( thermonuclease family)
VSVYGQDINLEQVRRGMAWHYKAYEREQAPVDRQAYAAAENAAKASRTGLWANPSPVAPWDFRRSKGSTPFEAIAQP